jgi:prepilin peptidase CpaA
LGILVSPWRHDWVGVGRGFWAGNGQGFGWHGLGQSFAGAGLGFLIFGALSFIGMGAGDVKLCTAIGAWIGPVQLFVALVVTSIAGGIMVLCWIAYRKIFRKLLLRVGDLVFRGKRNEIHGDEKSSLNDLLKSYMPYVPAIAIGTLLSFFAH